MRWGALDRAAREVFAILGRTIDVRRDADSLSPVEKTMTALARALSHDAPLLILDEPTAALTDAETSELFGAVRGLRARGVAILYVSHRLEEVFSICDRYTVLRNGKRVAGGDIAGTTIDAVIAAMAGSPARRDVPAVAAAHRARAARGRGARWPGVTDATFQLNAGEVVGIAGLSGSGRSELLRLIAGASPRATGRMSLEGRPFAPRDVRGAQRSGVVLVPQERRSQALIPDSVERNLNATTIDTHALARSSSRAVASAPTHARLWSALDIRGHSLDQEVLTLSGGNQQKVTLARFLALQSAHAPARRADPRRRRGHEGRDLPAHPCAGGRWSIRPDGELRAAGIHNMGSAFMEFSNIARNRAGFGGGGIANVQTGSFDIEDTTIHDNVAGTEGGGIANYDGAALTLTSVVFAGNVPNDCIGSPAC